MIDQIINNFYENCKTFNQNEKSIVWKNHQLDKFSNINEEKLKNFRNNGLSKGMDNDFLKPINMRLDLNRYNDKLIFHNTSFVELKKYLTKTNFGNSKNLLNIDDYYVGEANFKHLERIRDLNKYCFSKNKINLICEIGGGFGGLATMIMLEQTNLKYFLIDLPETNLLSHYYLSNTFPDKKIFSFTDIKDNVITTSDLDEFDIFILPPHMNYKDIKFDLFINFQSMQEMKKKTIKKYFDFIHSHITINGFFYNINRFYYDGTNEKNILSEYPYEKDRWNIIYTGPYKTARRSWNIISQNTEDKNTNFKDEMEKIKVLEKNFTPPNIPLIFIRFYRILKNLLNKKNNEYII